MLLLDSFPGFSRPARRLLFTLLQLFHGAGGAGEVGVVRVDVRAFDRDQALDIVGCRAQTLMQEIGHNVHKLRIELGESLQLLLIP